MLFRSARFLVASENGAYSKEVVTGADGTATLYPLVAGTYAVTELEAPAGYEIDNAGPQYVVLPSNGSTTVTVTFTDTPEITGESVPPRRTAIRENFEVFPDVGNWFASNITFNRQNRQSGKKS